MSEPITDDDKGGVVQLGDDQLSKLAETVTSKIMAAQKKAAEPDPDPEPIKNTDGKFSAKDIALEMKKLLTEQSNEDANRVYKTLWNDKLKMATDGTQGLGDYLKSEDDYGKVREDELNKIENFDERISALAKLTQSYNEALSGSEGKRPIVNKKAEKKAEETVDAYKELDRKMQAGEFKTVQDLTSAFFGAYNEEAKGLR